MGVFRNKFCKRHSSSLGGSSSSAVDYNKEESTMEITGFPSTTNDSFLLGGKDKDKVGEAVKFSTHNESMSVSSSAGSASSAAAADPSASNHSTSASEIQQHPLDQQQQQRNKNRNKNKKKSMSPRIIPTTNSVPHYINELKSARTTSGERAMRALRKLFAVSEHYAVNRIDMVHKVANASLVPTLFDFLARCGAGGKGGCSEQYLTLLVLNNISIPPENKRFIAIDCGGAAILSRLLCEDPSCHLTAIVLVNLTFADTELRSALVDENSDIAIIESLAFALRVASLTQAEYEHRQLLVEHNPEDPKTPRELLQSLLAEDQNQQQLLRSSGGGGGGGGGDNGTTTIRGNDDGSKGSNTSSSSGPWPSPALLPDSSKQLFPDTARWALSAIKNLTRPSKDATAVHSLIELGIVPHIMRFIVVQTLPRDSTSVSDKSGETAQTETSGGEDSGDTPVPSDPEERLDDGEVGSGNSKVPSDPEEPLDDGEEGSGCNSKNKNIDVAANDVDCNQSGNGSCRSCTTSSRSSCCSYEEEYNNSPTTWDSNSAQDAALFIVMNLCAVPSLRPYVRELDAIHLLSRITACERRESTENHPFVEEEILEFQRLKARMSLSYLVGSEGHFGQPRASGGRRSSSTIGGGSSNRSPRQMFSCKDDSTLIVTEPEVTRLVELLATTLHHRTKEGAGGYSAATFCVKYVLFSLRCLLVNYENQVKFANAQGTQLNSLLMKVLALHSVNDIIYVDAEAAEHASFSLYLISNYCFKDVAFLPSAYGHEKVTEMVAAKVLTAYSNRTDITPAGKHAVGQLMLRLRYLHFEGTAADLAVRSGSSTTASDFVLEEDLMKTLGATYVRPQKPGACPDDNIFDRPLFRRRAVRDNDGSPKRLREKPGPADSFPNALQAVQELSFASVRVRHLDAIDDILIANNIVHSANGKKTESYNCIWTWQDYEGTKRQLSSESFLTAFTPAKASDALPQAFSLLDSLCGMSDVA